MRIDEITNNNPRPHQNVPGVEFIPSEVTAADLTKIASFMKSKCGPWLHSTNNGNLRVFRGVKWFEGINSTVAFIKPTRQDRIPMTTNKARHDLYNMLINLMDGSANRTNSLFCTSSYDDADNYGTPFILIPIGPFQYTWSPVWKDWTCDATHEGMVNLWRDDVLAFFKRNNEKTGKYNLVLRKEFELNPNSYDLTKVANYIKCDEGLPEAIDRRKEIMIECDSALYIAPGKYRQVLPLL